MDCTTVRLVDGGYMKLKVSPELSVHDLLVKVLRKVSPESVQRERCGAFVFHLVRQSDANESRAFLCPHRLWSEVVRSFDLNGSCLFSLELSFQVFPAIYASLLPENASAFSYMLKQIKRRYFAQLNAVDNKEKAVTLGCLEVRAQLKEREASGKAALEVIEKHGGFPAFFPPCLLASTKPRQLKKLVQEEMRKVGSLAPQQADFRFIELLRELSDFEAARLRCSLGAGLASVEAELVISPKYAISLRIENSTQLKRVGDFCDIVDIQIDGPAKSVRTVFNGKEQEPLCLTFADIDEAEFAAHLIDAYRHDGSNMSEDNTVLHNGCSYCRLYNDESVYDGEDYADFQYGSASEEMPFRELPRHQIVLERMLGEGQFGDVYRGTMREGGEDLPVAVKTCKDSQDEASTQKFLQEAITMSQFDHPHIIRLVGVIKEKPIWIVMELASLGELRPYLIQNSETLDSATLLMFCYQISSALCYLEMRNIVHRDIAARNVLVSAKDCVKLADFGLTRWLETHSAYTSTQGKLPLKWMAPESIHYRRFSSASDVWMFAVCMWEILQVGVKPFQGVKNNDAIRMIENGQRLERPSRCPESTYTLMLSCWSYQAGPRPTFAQVKSKLFDMMTEQKRPTSPDAHLPPPPPKPSCNPGVRMEELMNQSLPALHVLTPPQLASSQSNPSLLLTGASPAATARPANAALPPVPGSPSAEDNTSPPVLRRAPERSRSFDSKRVLGEALAAARRSLSAEQIGSETSPAASPKAAAASPAKAKVAPVAEAAAVEETPVVTMEALYASVISVVKAVHSLNARVTGVPACESARLVGDIGYRLKELDTKAERLMEAGDLAEARRTGIRLARSVLTSDFADLFKAFKLAQGAEHIPRLYRDYCVEVLQKAQVLAIDSRQLYQAAACPTPANGE